MGKQTLPFLKHDSKILNVKVVPIEVVDDTKVSVKSDSFDIEDSNGVSIADKYLKRGETYYFQYDYQNTLSNHLIFRITYNNESKQDVTIPHRSYFTVPKNAKTIEYNNDVKTNTWVNIKLANSNGLFSMWKLDNTINRRLLTQNYIYASKMNPYYLSYRDRLKFGYNIRP